MAGRSYAVLAERGVLEISGKDRCGFLQGLVSNDVTKAAPDRALHAALLTAQGRYLHDFFIIDLDGALYLDTEAARLSDLIRRLALYKLRSNVTLADASERFLAGVAFGGDALAALHLPEEHGAAAPFGRGIAYADPRLAALGARFLVPRGAGTMPLDAAGLVRADPTAYDRLRLSLGVPDGSRDLSVEKTILLEAGFDELNGVDWQKGCYMGQELTARTKYRALIKRRLFPVTVEGPLPSPGTPVLLGEQEAGEMRSGRDGIGLALLRLDAVAEAARSGVPLAAGTACLTPHKPAWANF